MGERQVGGWGAAPTPSTGDVGCNGSYPTYPPVDGTLFFNPMLCLGHLGRKACTGEGRPPLPRSSASTHRKIAREAQAAAGSNSHAPCQDAGFRGNAWAPHRRPRRGYFKPVGNSRPRWAATGRLSAAEAGLRAACNSPRGASSGFKHSMTCTCAGHTVFGAPGRN